MKIAVLGANGRTGREIVELALNDGDQVTAVMRSSIRLREEDHASLTIKVGDVLDRDFLDSVLDGHDCVVSVLGGRWPTKAATSIYPKSADVLIPAMEASGVTRLVVTSTALLFPGVGFLKATLRWLVPNTISSARRMEFAFSRSDLNWTIVRVGFLTNAPATGCCSAVNEMPQGGSSISRTALARFLLNEVKSGQHIKRVVGVCDGA